MLKARFDQIRKPSSTMLLNDGLYAAPAAPMPVTIVANGGVYPEFAISDDTVSITTMTRGFGFGFHKRLI